MPGIWSPRPRPPGRRPLERRSRQDVAVTLATAGRPQPRQGAKPAGAAPALRDLAPWPAWSRFPDLDGSGNGGCVQLLTKPAPDNRHRARVHLQIHSRKALLRDHPSTRDGLEPSTTQQRRRRRAGPGPPVWGSMILGSLFRLDMGRSKPDAARMRSLTDTMVAEPSSVHLASSCTMTPLPGG